MTKPDDLFLGLQDALSGRYSLDREIGRGGMGVVYLAHEVHLDRLVAIKVLPPERAADPALRQRFLKEVRLAARLSHPNIIPIHAVEETPAFVFYVMAFVDGDTLTDRVRNRGPFSGTEGARVLREVAWALAYAHDQGIVHRDVKPDNILIERATGRVLVADFGIAAALGNASLDGVTGTPEVMSPEQVLGKPLDARTDIYALGATAFFAFSGRYPFDAATTTELLAKHVASPPPELAALGLSVPRKLTKLVDHCLCKPPDERPPTANAVAEKLTVVLEQRREIPVALRSFIKRSARINGSGTLVGAVTLLPASIAVSAALGAAAGFAALGLSTIGFPFAYMTVVARRLVQQGFAHGDLEPAFKTEIEQCEEEIGSERRATFPIAERIAKWVTQASAVSAVLSLGVIFSQPSLGHGLLGDVPLIWFIGSYTVAIVTGIIFTGLAQQHRDVDGRFWAKLWQGSMGRGAFSLGAKFAGSHVRTTAMTHRATELSIGLAAEHLFESLPKETRKALSDVPALVARLQADVQSLRRQQEDLQELGASAAPEIGILRDSVRGKLTQAVGALETIRLDLLRLHAGSTTVQSVTTHIGVAEEVSRDIGRLIAAKSDVERMLRFPSEATPTPV
jgi:serine/threonine-protein kinase